MHKVLIEDKNGKEYVFTVRDMIPHPTLCFMERIYKTAEKRGEMMEFEQDGKKIKVPALSVEEEGMVNNRLLRDMVVEPKIDPSSIENDGMVIKLLIMYIQENLNIKEDEIIGLKKKVRRL